MRRESTCMLGGVVAALVGWLALNAVACDKNDGDSAQAEAIEQSQESQTDESAANDSGAAGSEGLPGELEAGEREPEAPGPEAPAIMAMTGLKGYLEPCGCTADVLLGGAERIVGYVKAARRLYTDTVMVDGGDTLFETAELEDHQVPQERAKAEIVARVQNELDTRWTVPGERDFALGLEFYRQMLEASGLEALGANVKLGGESLKPDAVASVGDWRVGFIGAVDPTLYESIDGVEASDASEAVGGVLEEEDIAGADARVLVLHGGLKLAKELLEAHPALDFVVVGHDPRETDQVDRVGNGGTLEPYDQGRYVGILSLYGVDKPRPFKDASGGSKAERERVERQIEHVRESIEDVESELDDGEEAPPILDRLKERLEKYRQEKQKLEDAELTIPDSRKGFVWRSVPMKPGYPVDEPIRKKRKAYNARLEEMNRKVERSVPEVPDGQATYVGTNQCATCHGEAHDFWEDTSHARAVETLESRDKLFDQNCVGCHVVGYEKPGGSVVAKLKYEATVQGETWTKDLRNVGCETCHGPGSKHRKAPVGSDGQPQHIEIDPGRGACMECHVPEHSPGFEFESYVDQITGEGHRRSAE